MCCCVCFPAEKPAEHKVENSLKRGMLRDCDCPTEPRAYGRDEVPRYMRCPISGRYLTDAVILEDGYSYDRHALIESLARHRRSPVTGAPLGSVKFFPNNLLRHAIVLRDAWAESGAREPSHRVWALHTPPRSVRPFESPVCLSDGETYELEQLAWLDGRHTSPSVPGAPLRDRELLIPNLAVAAMVRDAGFPAPTWPDYSRKRPVWSTHHACGADDAFQASCCAAQGCCCPSLTSGTQRPARAFTEPSPVLPAWPGAYRASCWPRPEGSARDKLQ